MSEAPWPMRDPIVAAVHRNYRQETGPDAEYAVARLITGGLPLDVAAAALRGMGRGLERAGFDAYFREETGFAVLWCRRKQSAR